MIAMVPGKDKKGYIPPLNIGNAYKYIFCFFAISGLSAKSHARTNNVRYRLIKFTNIAFNILIVLLQLFFCISSIFHSDSKNKKGGVVFACVSLTYCSFRMYMWINNSEYKLIVEHFKILCNNYYVCTI